MHFFVKKCVFDIFHGNVKKCVFDNKFGLENQKREYGDSRGVVKTNLVKALLETRGCRWISYSNSKQYS